MAAITTIAISKCVGVTTTGTYTCVITGPNLIAGTPVGIQGFVANTTFNGSFILKTVTGNPTTSFTCAISSTTATETIAATGKYDPEGVQSYPTADTMSSPLGFGIGPRLRPYVDLLPYGDFIPGRLPGTQQSIDI
jgi:hypothetical protein